MGNNCLMSSAFQFSKMHKVLEINGGGHHHNNVNVLNVYTLKCTLKMVKIVSFI